MLGSLKAILLLFSNKYKLDYYFNKKVTYYNYLLKLMYKVTNNRG